MCLKCDGWSDDEIHDHYEEVIAEYGWMVQHVGGGSLSRPPWSYTIGLSQGWDHPELVAVGLPTRNAHGLLNELGRQVRGGTIFEAGATASNPDGTLEVGFVEVHPLLWEGPLLVGWLDYYESRGLAPDQRALQVVAPMDMCGRGAFRWQPCLDDHDCLVGHGEDGPSRHPFHDHRRGPRVQRRRRT